MEVAFCGRFDSLGIQDIWKAVLLGLQEAGRGKLLTQNTVVNGG